MAEITHPSEMTYDEKKAFIEAYVERTDSTALKAMKVEGDTVAEPKLEIERRMDRLESAVLMLAQKLGVEDEVEENLDTAMPVVDTEDE